jgi:hypothetical protein
VSVCVCVWVCVCPCVSVCVHGTWKGESILGHGSDLADRLQRNAQAAIRDEMQYNGGFSKIKNFSVVKCRVS